MLGSQLQPTPYLPRPHPSPSPPRRDRPCSQFGHSRDAVKRSINLALSVRGQAGFEAVGLLDKVMDGVVPMPCRAIHGRDGKLTTQPYGKPGQAIYSVSRALLNRVLMDECDKLPNVRCTFETGVHAVTEDGTLTVETRGSGLRTLRPRLIIGADGAYSSVRNAMLRFSRADFSRHYIEHGYKELTMPPTATGDFAMPTANALHIWPRHEFMMIALPNPDKTFTCTLFLPYPMFAEMEADLKKVRPFFEKYFPDALPLIPELERQFATNPTGALVTVRVKPWNYGDKFMLIGDAAHSSVPFYGQGMNCAMEDCLSFMETLDALRGDLGAAVHAWAARRQPAGEALSNLSLENYVEMRAKTASRAFLLRKRLEGLLQTLMPGTWIPQYSMVAFTRIPYDEVVERAKRQEKILDIAFYSLSAAALASAVAAAAVYGPRLLERLR